MMYFGQLFLSQMESYLATQLGSQDEQYKEGGCSQKWGRYGPSVFPWAKHSASSVTGKASFSLSAYLGFHLSRKCSVAVSL